MPRYHHIITLITAIVILFIFNTSRRYSIQISKEPTESDDEADNGVTECGDECDDDTDTRGEEGGSSPHQIG